jgi:hypothetical protein
LNAMAPESLSDMAPIASKLMPHRDFLRAARGEKPDITALAVRRAQRVVLCRRLRERAKSIPCCRS